MMTLSCTNGTANGAIQNVPITILNDLILEGTETIVVFASTQPELSASFVPGHNRIIIPILDNDGKQNCILNWHIQYINVSHGVSE